MNMEDLINQSIKGKHSIVRDVKLGENVKIWSFCNLYECVIGNNTQIGSYSEIKKEAVIGNDCRFQSYVFVPEQTRIGNRVFVGPAVKFMNDMYPTAMKAIRGEWKCEPVIVEDDVTIGGGALIRPGVKIGRGAVIGMGAVVIKDVPADAIVVGNPAKILGYTTEGKYREFRREHGT